MKDEITFTVYGATWNELHAKAEEIIAQFMKGGEEIPWTHSLDVTPSIQTYGSESVVVWEAEVTVIVG